MTARGFALLCLGFVGPLEPIYMCAHICGLEVISTHQTGSTELTETTRVISHGAPIMKLGAETTVLGIS